LLRVLSRNLSKGLVSLAIFKLQFLKLILKHSAIFNGLISLILFLAFRRVIRISSLKNLSLNDIQAHLLFLRDSVSRTVRRSKLSCRPAFVANPLQKRALHILNLLLHTHIKLVVLLLAVTFFIFAVFAHGLVKFLFVLLCHYSHLLDIFKNRFKFLLSLLLVKLS
jgi:hypothetical protein